MSNPNQKRETFLIMDLLMTSLQESREADDEEDEVNPEFEEEEDQVVTAPAALVTAASAPVVPAPIVPVVAALVAQVAVAIAPVVVAAVVLAPAAHVAVAVAPVAPDIVENFDGFVDAFFENRGIARSDKWISFWAEMRENVVEEAPAAIMVVEEEEAMIDDVLIPIPFDLDIIFQHRYDDELSTVDGNEEGERRMSDFDDNDDAVTVVI